MKRQKKKSKLKVALLRVRKMEVAGKIKKGGNLST
jgi:hypothetical protein